MSGVSASGSLAPFAAVIGSPVRHSLSPVIHAAGFRSLGVDWTYAAFDVAPGRAADAAEAMRLFGFGGLSVTMPHKADVVDALDRLDGAAIALASVNTICWRGDDLVGVSTDGEGFVRALGARGVDVAGRRIAVLGAGGAARSVVEALGRHGASDIAILNRSIERAATATALSAVGRLGTPSDVTEADLVVNATSVGMGAGSELPCPVEWLRPAQVVADLVYHPLETPWLAAASALGATVIDGLGMLVHQAALQQQLWLGDLPDVSAMREAARSALAGRPVA